MRIPWHLALPLLSSLSSPCPSVCLQEFFFTPFVARGRVSLKRRKDNFSKAPEDPQPRLKSPQWCSTQDCPQGQRKRGKMGADVDCSRLCAGGQEVGCTYIHVFRGPGVSCLSVHPGPVY